MVGQHRLRKGTTAFCSSERERARDDAFSGRDAVGGHSWRSARTDMRTPAYRSRPRRRPARHPRRRRRRYSIRRQLKSAFEVKRPDRRQVFAYASRYRAPQRRMLMTACPIPAGASLPPGV
ncbi:hypothetical protein EVAR_27209_1 [Eumeta japonica]|uniref:Uncharacterized protein n=1 Tax=Eumeta variegata TaxID=151549 RepID=A0A4C1VUJ3_EUMVA|nr:hypothetical protein EVAR_27209_1 [Eumeta japonica]